MASNDPDESPFDPSPKPGAKRINRWRGRIGLACQRVRSRGLDTAPKRTAMSVVGVAIAIALLVSVTGLAVGIASPMATAGESGEYWIVPEASGDRSPLVATGDPQFGSAHAAHERILEFEDVESATPLLMAVVQVETESGATEYVAVLGVVPGPNGEPVGGVSTAAMTPGDPHYGDGSYDGPWTGELVLSEAAATLLEVDAGDDLSVSSGATTQSVSAVDVDDRGDGVSGTTPVAVMQLSELQTITGAAEHDQADQFLVRTSSAAAVADLEGVYDEAAVRSSTELTTQQVLDSDLALALSLTAIVVSVLVGTLFVGTTMVLEVVGDRSQLTTLHAMGIGTGSQLSLYAVQSIVVAGLGGVLGGTLGLAGIRASNHVAARVSSVDAVAVGRPMYLVYGVAVALVIGLLTVPLLGLTLWQLDVGGDRIRE